MHAHPGHPWAIYAGNWPRDALTFLSVRNIKKPGANFVNYQGYSTPSHDGLPEIERDLKRGVLGRPAHFIVETAKIEAFSARLQSRYKLQDEGELRRYDVPITHVFRVG